MSADVYAHIMAGNACVMLYPVRPLLRPLTNEQHAMLAYPHDGHIVEEGTTMEGLEVRRIHEPGGIDPTLAAVASLGRDVLLAPIYPHGSTAHRTSYRILFCTALGLTGTFDLTETTCAGYIAHRLRVGSPWHRQLMTTSDLLRTLRATRELTYVVPH